MLSVPGDANCMMTLLGPVILPVGPGQEAAQLAVSSEPLLSKVAELVLWTSIALPCIELTLLEAVQRAEALPPAPAPSLRVCHTFMKNVLLLPASVISCTHVEGWDGSSGVWDLPLTE